MDLELEQINVALTKDSEVLGMLRNRKQMRKDSEGEYYPVVFNSQEIKFRAGAGKVLGKSVALCLMRSSFVIVGDDLTGEMVPVLVAGSGFTLNELADNRPTCETCGKDFPTARALAHHMLREHKENFDAPATAVAAPHAASHAAPEKVSK